MENFCFWNKISIYGEKIWPGINKCVTPIPTDTFSNAFSIFSLLNIAFVLYTSSIKHGYYCISSLLSAFSSWLQNLRKQHLASPDVKWDFLYSFIDPKYLNSTYTVISVPESILASISNRFGAEMDSLSEEPVMWLSRLLLESGHSMEKNIPFYTILNWKHRKFSPKRNISSPFNIKVY